jgi:dienelactone hydrolase
VFGVDQGWPEAAGRWLDEAFVGFAFRGRPPDPARQDQNLARLDGAHAFYGVPANAARLYADPVAVEPEVHPVGRLDGGLVVDIRWPSGYRPVHDDYAALCRKHPNNRVVKTRWYRHSTPRPAVIVLHGWSGGHTWVDPHVYRAGWLYRQGLDVLMIQLPFHGERATLERIFPPVFPSYNDPIRTVEGFAQATQDIRGLVAWLLDVHARPAVGVFGMSLGGFLAALVATAEPRLAFAVPGIPFATFPDMVWDSTDAATSAPLGLTHARFVRAFEAIDPTLRPCAFDPASVCIVYGEHDQVTPAKHARRLHAHFAGSSLRTFSGSHLLQWHRGPMFDAVVELAGQASA